MQQRHIMSNRHNVISAAALPSEIFLHWNLWQSK